MNAQRKKSTSGGSTALVDAYLAKVPEPARTALHNLRAIIRSEAPDAEEVMTYGMPGFRQRYVLVGYKEAKNHCSFFPMSPGLMDRLEPELGGSRAAKGTLHFTPGNPLPEELVRLIVRERLAEVAAKPERRD